MIGVHVLGDAPLVGIDAMVWLHLFVNVFADKVAAGEYGEVVSGFTARVIYLIGQGVSAIPVFDGSGTPAKAGTAEARRTATATRVSKLSAALAEASSETTAKDLKLKIAKAQSRSSPALIDEVIISLQRSGVPYVVAPHEADHQLVHMAQRGIIDFVVTVDADFLCHTGVKMIFTESGGFYGGGARVFDPAVEVREPADGDLGAIIKLAKAKVRGDAVEVLDGEVGAAVCLAYALLVGNDYMLNLADQFGPASAYAALLWLLENKADILSDNLRALYDPTCLLEAAQAVKPRLSFADNSVARIARATAAFKRGLVYFMSGDPSQRTIRSMDGSNSASTDLGYLGVLEPDPERALLLAIGRRCRRNGCEVCMDNDSATHGLDGEPVQRFVALDLVDGHQLKLTYDMLPGSYLNKSELQSAGVAQLKRWLKCRGVPCSGGNRDDLRVAAVNMFNVEEANPDNVELQCPDGRSVMEYLIKAKVVREIDVPLFHTELFETVRDSSEWKETMLDIRAHAAVVDNYVIQRFYKDKDINTSRACKVLDRGHARFANRSILAGFGYLVSVPRHPNHCAFRIDCPRSFNVTKYKVVVLCKTATIEGASVPKVKSVVAVWCACPAAKGGLCVHGSALLHVVRDLDRPIESGVESSPTAQMCVWNRPGGRSLIDSSVRLASLPISRTSRLREASTRDAICHREDAGRLTWPPFLPADELRVLRRLASEEHVEQQLAAFQRFLDVCDQHAGADGCAMSTVYHPQIEPHTASRWSMWRDNAKQLIEQWFPD
jgi:hypothetical protein